jgi:uncharacterized membrane protein
MLKRLRVRVEQLRENLFFVPALYVAAAVVAAELMIALDGRLARSGGELPLVLQSTAASARVLLSTIAGATITVAGVVFAITLVSIQLASSQFSPRVIPGFLRDFHQQQVMGFVVGTFTYCLMVLAAVREPGVLGEGVGVPHLSVDLALALALLAILGIVAFLDHGARSLQVGEIIRRVALETRHRIDELYPHTARTAPPQPLHDAAMPASAGHVVRAKTSGWVRHIDVEAILRATPDTGVARLDVRNGSFVAERQPICTLWPTPEDPPAAEASVRQALVLGDSRMMLQDVAFGMRQLVDIALRALSPGVNDPTTAYDVIMHLGNVMRDLLWRDLAPIVRVADGRRLVAAADLSHDDYVNRAFDQIRAAGASQSAMVAALMLVTGGIVMDLERDGLADRTSALRRQGALLLDGYGASHPLPDDLERVRTLARRYGFALDDAATTKG